MGQDKHSLIREGKEPSTVETTSDARAVTHSLSPASGLLEMATLERLPLHFIVENDAVCCMISPWSVQVSCCSCVPSQPLAHSQHIA